MNESLNALELALLQGNDELNFYLGEVKVEDFREHIQEIKRKYTDKAIIREMIKELTKLL